MHIYQSSTRVYRLLALLLLAVALVGTGCSREEGKRGPQAPETQDSDSSTSATQTFDSYSMIVDPVSGEPAVAAMYVKPGLRSKQSVDKLIMAVWADGRVVWSRDPLSGGSPYYLSHVLPSEVDQAIAELGQDGFFTDQSVNRRRQYVGPDAGYITLVVAQRGKTQELLSWHESFMTNTQVVVTEKGVEPLAGRSREEVLSGVSPAYLRFMELWQSARRHLLALARAPGEEMGYFQVTLRSFPVIETRSADALPDANVGAASKPRTPADNDKVGPLPPSEP